VIATASTAEKAERLKALGASDVINYTETPDWDAKVRELTDGCGVDCIVEIGGPGTIGLHRLVLNGLGVDPYSMLETGVQPQPSADQTRNLNQANHPHSEAGALWEH
jgi:NADPH:quinone reductase-like Zn-dependent oxidoreductase